MFCSGSVSSSPDDDAPPPPTLARGPSQASSDLKARRGAERERERE